MQFLEESFDHQVRNGNNTLELTRDHNDSRVNLVPRAVQTTPLSVPQDGQNINRTTENVYIGTRLAVMRALILNFKWKM